MFVLFSYRPCKVHNMLAKLLCKVVEPFESENVSCKVFRF